jgi:dethiobiotin synthetase
MKALFVTATGTEVGKTYVTAGIIRASRQRGDAASAIKPVMSGYDAQMRQASDAGILLQAMGKPVNEKTVAAIAPWRYAAPLSPDMAAAREGRVLDLPRILTFCTAAIQAAPGLMLVEGVGGVMVPLDAAHTVRDWIAALNLSTLLIAGSYLGTISHTLTAAEALLSRGINIATIVINESEISPVPPEQTAAAISRFLPDIALHIIPRHLNNISFLQLTDYLNA